jgi:hypothetical protein
MTRHNLEDHISWLLSQNITFPVVPGLARTDTEPSAANIDINVLEEETEEEVSRCPPSPARARSPSGTITVRPSAQPPLSSIPPRQQFRENINTFETAQMGKLESAQRSTRPTLHSQHQQQLATPASTTGSTAAPLKASLSQSYSKWLKTGENGMTGHRNCIM